MKTNKHDPVDWSQFKPSPTHVGKGELPGLTKREYFAALNLQGAIANPAIQDISPEVIRGAVGFADALIEELNK